MSAGWILSGSATASGLAVAVWTRFTPHVLQRKWLSRYIQLRRSEPGPLFLYVDNKPVSRTYLAKILIAAVKLAHIKDRITPHSFRIGAATRAAQTGYTSKQTTARIYCRFVKSTAVQTHSPTNDVDGEENDPFYEQLQKEIDATQTQNLLIIIGVANAKVG